MTNFDFNASAEHPLVTRARAAASQAVAQLAACSGESGGTTVAERDRL